MKRTIIAGLVLVLTAGVFAAPGVEAGLFKKSKSKRTEMPEWMQAPRRFDRAPTMAFVSGTLDQDGWTGWKIGETKLQFAEDCQISSEGAAISSLEAGTEVVVMGPRVGDTIVAWSVRVQKPDFSVGRKVDHETELIYSETNPNVGEIVKAPY
jgi:hypothetical protein